MPVRLLKVPTEASASIPARSAEPKGNASSGRVFSIVDMTTDKGKN